MEYVNFGDVCAKVAFKAVLDHWNIPYTESRDSIKGQTDKFPFIIDPSKNLFLSPGRDDVRGSPINFISQLEGLSLREAALKLKHLFLTEQKQEEKPIPDLQLDHEHKSLEASGITPEEAKRFEIGYCGKGIMRGRIAFTIRDSEGKKVGYVGRATKEDQKPLYLFPKSYKHEHIYLLNTVEDKKWCILTADPLDCLLIHSLFPHRGVSLLSLNMTEAQQFLLNQMKMIYILHPQPDNVALRLCKYSLIKAPKLPRAVRHMDKDEIAKLLR